MSFEFDVFFVDYLLVADIFQLVQSVLQILYFLVEIQLLLFQVLYFDEPIDTNQLQVLVLFLLYIMTKSTCNF